MHSPSVYSKYFCRRQRRLVAFFCGILLPLLVAAANPTPASDKVSLQQRNEPPAQALDSFTITHRSDGYRVHITYPQLGNTVADAELAIWAREQASAFIHAVGMIPTPPPTPYELEISYEMVKASSRVISVVFFISTSMGGAHPEPGMATFVYDKHDGRRLSYNDLFINRDNSELVRSFSAICRQSLAEQLDGGLDAAMLNAGTAPDMANFDLFALTPNGIRVYFPPYQAAPYSAGYLNVTIPLADLAAFSPLTVFWDAP